MCNHPITEALLKDKRVKVNDVLKLQYDYNPDKKEDLGTILHWAVKNNKNEVIDILKPYIKSEHVNLESEYGNMPLHSAVAYSNVTIVKSLLEIPNIDVNVLNRWSCYPISFAKSAEMVFMLIEAGADIKSEKGKKGLVFSMLRFAKNGDSKSLEKLLSHKSLRKVIDINAIGSFHNYNNVTVLEVAAFEGDMKMLKMLAKHRPNANLKSINVGDKGKAILHCIAEKYSDSKCQNKKAKMKDVMILLILLFNADLNLKDSNGKKPFDYLGDEDFKKDLESKTMINSILAEKYVNYLFNRAQVGFWEKEAPEEKRICFDEYFSERVFKYLSDIDKKNFFLSIVSDQTNDYLQFLSNLRSWLSKKERNKSIDEHIKDLSNNFDQLMDEYVRDNSNLTKTSNSNDNPSTPLSTARVEKGDKSCTIM